ncbi:hypothetical protein BN1263300005 [Stenotrophomonas thermophila]|nr:hypothetical protein BN1263300005 [Stenotrophomonas maltophilia]
MGPPVQRPERPAGTGPGSSGAANAGAVRGKPGSCGAHPPRMPVGIFIPFGYESKNKLLTDIPARVTQPLPPALGKCRCGSCRSQTASACRRPVCRAAAVGVGHAGDGWA